MVYLGESDMEQHGHRAMAHDAEGHLHRTMTRSITGSEMVESRNQEQHYLWQRLSSKEAVSKIE